MRIGPLGGAHEGALRQPRLAGDRKAGLVRQRRRVQHHGAAVAAEGLGREGIDPVELEWHQWTLTGARSFWHTPPLGQTLIVTAGCGWVQREGGLVETIRPGDVVWFEPGEKHWHGASPTTAMTHVAIQEAQDGKAVDWMEHVTDEQYGIGAE